MSYEDYGFDFGEDRELREHCRKSDFCDQETLLTAAIASNPEIASDLYYSLVNGVSYEKLSMIKYIPIAKPDFYGYQRRCLSIFRNFLLMYGKWR